VRQRLYSFITLFTIAEALDTADRHVGLGLQTTRFASTISHLNSSPTEKQKASLAGLLSHFFTFQWPMRRRLLPTLNLQHGEARTLRVERLAARAADVRLIHHREHQRQDEHERHDERNQLRPHYLQHQRQGRAEQPTAGVSPVSSTRGAGGLEPLHEPAARWRRRCRSASCAGA
jgi:hypothetical protein